MAYLGMQNLGPPRKKALYQNFEVVRNDAHYRTALQLMSDICDIKLYQSQNFTMFAKYTPRKLETFVQVTLL